MNKLMRPIIMALLLTAVAGTAHAARTSVSLATFLAKIDFGVTRSIQHTLPVRVSPALGVAVATGTVTDTSGINYVRLYYKYDGDEGYTALRPQFASFQNTFNFSFSIPVPSDATGLLHYYIKVVDGVTAPEIIPDNTFYWPPLGESQPAEVVIMDSAVADVTTGGGVVTLPGVNGSGETSVSIPAGALDATVSIAINEISPESSDVPSGSFTSTPLCIYNFTPEGLQFNKPVTLSLPYKDANSDGIVDGTTLNVADLKIMWWDGFDWTLVGGTVDSDRKVVICQIQHFSMYALFAPSLTDNDFRPVEKIITPATVDGVNDTARFRNMSAGDSVSIYDVRGKRIRQLQGAGTVPWDGRDDDGNMVESGIYIYQMKVAGKKTLSGTIIVAK